MDLIMSTFGGFWMSMEPTTWILVLGLLVAFNLLRKVLF